LRGAQRALNARDYRHVESAEIVGGNESDRIGAAANQAPDEIVGPELESLSRAYDAFARFRTQAAAPIERFRHRPDRDTRRGGYIPDRGVPSMCARRAVASHLPSSRFTRH